MGNKCLLIYVNFLFSLFLRSRNRCEYFLSNIKHNFSISSFLFFLKNISVFLIPKVSVNILSAKIDPFLSTIVPRVALIMSYLISLFSI